MYMNVTSPPERCTSVDITTTSVTVGNSSDLTYTYWKDPNAIVPLPDPKHVTTDGTYYIKGRSSSGCTMILPVEVIITKLEPLNVFEPPTVSYPTTVDITQAVIQEEGLNYTYWMNQQATIPLKNPNAIRLPGTYYIKATNSEGCNVLAPVKVNILLPDFMIPNTFTPNGDGVNDVFTVIVGNAYTIKSFKIFNRWGDIVYETTDIYKYWDGLKENSNVPTGVYYWVLDGDENLKSFRKSGYVTVLR
jgi:gliding motility-associated-like protein